MIKYKWHQVKDALGADTVLVLQQSDTGRVVAQIEKLSTGLWSLQYGTSTTQYVTAAAAQAAAEKNLSMWVTTAEVEKPVAKGICPYCGHPVNSAVCQQSHP